VSSAFLKMSMVDSNAARISVGAVCTAAISSSVCVSDSSATSRASKIWVACSWVMTARTSGLEARAVAWAWVGSSVSRASTTWVTCSGVKVDRASTRASVVSASAIREPTSSSLRGASNGV